MSVRGMGPKLLSVYTTNFYLYALVFHWYGNATCISRVHLPGRAWRPPEQSKVLIESEPEQ